MNAIDFFMFKIIKEAKKAKKNGKKNNWREHLGSLLITEDIDSAINILEAEIAGKDQDKVEVEIQALALAKRLKERTPAEVPPPGIDQTTNPSAAGAEAGK